MKMIILFSLCCFLLKESNQKIRILVIEDNYMDIVVNGTGQTESIYDVGHSVPIKIYVNNIELSYVSYSVYLEPGLNNIRLVYNSSANDFNLYFLAKHNLIEVDFSHLDFSNIENVENMFAECYGLKKVNFAGVKARSDINSNTMFNFVTQAVAIYKDSQTELSNIESNLPSSKEIITDTKYESICYKNCELNIKINNLTIEGIKLVENKTEIIQTNNTIIQVYPIKMKNNDENSNASYIDLSEQADLLINYFNCSNIFIISTETKEEKNSGINKINFKILDEKGNEISDLSKFNDITIPVEMTMQNLESINYDYALSFIENDVNIFDKNSVLYKDKCLATKIGDNDIVLTDRLKDIYPNGILLCPDGCKLKEAKIKEKKFNCDCPLTFSSNNFTSTYTENNTLAEDTKLSYFELILNKINYDVYPCYNLLLNKENLKNNIPFYILIGTFTTILLLDLAFCFKGYRNIGEELSDNIPTKESLFKLKKEQEELRKKDLERNNTKESKIANKEENENKGEPPKKSKNEKTKCKSKTIDKIKTSKSEQNNVTNANKFIIINLGFPHLVIRNDNKSINEDYSELSYSQAKRLEKRNFAELFFYYFTSKIEIIRIFCYKIKYTNTTILLSNFILSLYINLYFNSLLYSEDVIHEKYNNNGKLNKLTELLLSIISNILTSIISLIFRFLSNYDIILKIFIEKNKNEETYKNQLNNLLSMIKKKLAIYFICQVLLILGVSYYLILFCILYSGSQKSLFKDFLLSQIEGIAITLASTLLVSLLRIIGLRCNSKNMYNISKYIDQKF